MLPSFPPSPAPPLLYADPPSLPTLLSRGAMETLETFCYLLVFTWKSAIFLARIVLHKTCELHNVLDCCNHCALTNI